MRFIGSAIKSAVQTCVARIGPHDEGAEYYRAAKLMLEQSPLMAAAGNRRQAADTLGGKRVISTLAIVLGGWRFSVAISLREMNFLSQSERSTLLRNKPFY